MSSTPICRRRYVLSYMLLYVLSYMLLYVLSYTALCPSYVFPLCPSYVFPMASLCRSYVPPMSLLCPLSSFPYALCPPPSIRVRSPPLRRRSHRRHVTRLLPPPPLAALHAAALHAPLFAPPHRSPLSPLSTPSLSSRQKSQSGDPHDRVKMGIPTSRLFSSAVGEYVFPGDRRVQEGARARGRRRRAAHAGRGADAREAGASAEPRRVKNGAGSTDMSYAGVGDRGDAVPRRRRAHRECESGEIAGAGTRRRGTACAPLDRA